MQGTQIDHSPIGNISTTKKVSMPTRMEEIKPVVLVKYEFEYREKLKVKGFFWEFANFQDSDAWRKTLVF